MASRRTQNRSQYRCLAIYSFCVAAATPHTQCMCFVFAIRVRRAYLAAKIRPQYYTHFAQTHTQTRREKNYTNKQMYGTYLHGAPRGIGLRRRWSRELCDGLCHLRQMVCRHFWEAVNGCCRAVSRGAMRFISMFLKVNF